MLEALALDQKHAKILAHVSVLGHAFNRSNDYPRNLMEFQEELKSPDLGDAGMIRNNRLGQNSRMAAPQIARAVLRRIACWSSAPGLAHVCDPPVSQAACSPYPAGERLPHGLSLLSPQQHKGMPWMLARLSK